MEFLSAMVIGATRFAVMIAAIALAALFLRDLAEPKPEPHCPCCPARARPVVRALAPR